MSPSQDRPGTRPAGNPAAAGQKMCFEQDDGKSGIQGLYDVLSKNSKVDSWHKISRYVSTRFSEDQEVPSLFKMRQMRERIFDSIYEKFAKGSRLLRYDQYTRAE